MSNFLTTFAAALLAALFLTTGVGHAARWRSFAALISEHGVVPTWLVAPVAFATGLAEIAVGVTASAVLLGATLVPARWVFAAALVLGAAFATYILYLLRAGRNVSGCGCSPLQSRLTRASLAPGLASVIVAGLGLGASAVPPGGASARLLASLWGVTLGGIALLVPAAVSQPTGGTG